MKGERAVRKIWKQWERDTRQIHKRLKMPVTTEDICLVVSEKIRKSGLDRRTAEYLENLSAREFRALVEKALKLT